MKRRLTCALLVLAVAAAPGYALAQATPEPDEARIESLGPDLTAEWRRLGTLATQPVSEATRSLNTTFATSAREALEIHARLRFIASLSEESPDNPSLTEKLGRESGALRRQAETLRNLIRGLSPGGRLDRLLRDLVDQAESVERSIGRRSDPVR